MQQVDILPSIPQGMSLDFSKAEADCIAFQSSGITFQRIEVLLEVE
jgi:hypothetical protein